MAAHQTFARRPDALSPERSSSASNLGRIAFLTVDQSFFCREDQWMLRLLLPTHESKGKRSSKLLRPPAFADRFYPCSPPSPLAPILTPVLLALRQPAWRAWASTESCQDTDKHRPQASNCRSRALRIKCRLICHTPPIQKMLYSLSPGSTDKRPVVAASSMKWRMQERI